MRGFNPSTALVAALATSASAGTYTLTDDYTSSPANFFNKMDFFTEPDPTNGFVKYQNAKAAITSKLIGYTPSTSNDTSSPHNIYVGVNSDSVTPEGRPSIRFSSQQAYTPGTLLVANLAHIPSGCGVWSALWMLGEGTWPNGGEIDILEEVNLATSNAMTLHTNTGCTIGPSGPENPFTGKLMTPDCDVNAPAQGKNQGCQIKAPEPSTDMPATFGVPFNAQGGGVYATEWTNEAISIWFFAANSPDKPDFSGATVNTKTFGPPLARFGSKSCNIAEKFKNLKIVLDTTFCGDWAGNTWQSGGCAHKTGVATCQAFVQNHPEAFKQAYWNIKGLKVFTSGAAGAASASTPKALRDIDIDVIEETKSVYNNEDILNDRGSSAVEVPGGSLVAASAEPLNRGPPTIGVHRSPRPSLPPRPGNSPPKHHPSVGGGLKLKPLADGVGLVDGMPLPEITPP